MLVSRSRLHLDGANLLGARQRAPRTPSIFTPNGSPDPGRLHPSRLDLDVSLEYFNFAGKLSSNLSSKLVKIWKKTKIRVGVGVGVGVVVSSDNVSVKIGVFQCYGYKNCFD